MSGVTVAPVAPALPTIPLDRAVAKYVALRDKVEAIKKANAEVLKQYTQLMEMLEAVMNNYLNTSSTISLKTVNGTCYRSTTNKCSVADWPVLLAYIQQNEAWDLLTHAANKVVVQATLDDTGLLVPGIKLERYTCVRVMRA